MTALRADRDAGWFAVGMRGSLTSRRRVLPDPEAVAAVFDEELVDALPTERTTGG
jgi:hypothetical protein